MSGHTPGRRCAEALHEIGYVPVEDVEAIGRFIDEKTAAPDLLAALNLILPLAKGYAAANRVGSNAEYIRTAEATIAAAEGRGDHG